MHPGERVEVLRGVARGRRGGERGGRRREDAEPAAEGSRVAPRRHRRASARGLERGARIKRAAHPRGRRRARAPAMDAEGRVPRGARRIVAAPPSPPPCATPGAGTATAWPPTSSRPSRGGASNGSTSASPSWTRWTPSSSSASTRRRGRGLARVPGDAFRRGQERQRLREHHTSAGRAGRGAQPGRRHRPAGTCSPSSRVPRSSPPRSRPRRGYPSWTSTSEPGIRTSPSGRRSRPCRRARWCWSGALEEALRHHENVTADDDDGTAGDGDPRGRRGVEFEYGFCPERGPDGVPGGQGRGRERRGDCSGETRRRRVRARGAARSKVRAGDCRRRARAFSAVKHAVFEPHHDGCPRRR